MIVSINDLNKLNLKIEKWQKIYLKWDLAAGKTTLTSYILNKFFNISEKIKSPTYIHYKKYNQDIYHFDLYRVSSYDEFVNIWWEEILDNPENTCIIEWPEIIENYYKPDIVIKLSKIEWREEVRNIEIN